MATPTLASLYQSIRNQIQTELDVNTPSIGNFFVNVFAAVQAAKLKLFYIAIADVKKNIFVDTADPEVIGGTLERFGLVFLGRAPFAARQGTYQVTVTGTVGAVIDSGTLFSGDDESTSPGFLFQLDTQVTLATATQTITLRALVGGTESQLVVNDTLTSTRPLLNINDQVTVTAITTSPTNAEDIENYREEIIRTRQLEPQGGAATDYRLWASDAAGVLNSYPFVRSGEVNVVDVFIEASVADSTDGKGTPSAAILTEAEAVIREDPDTTIPQNDRGRLPLLVNLNVLPVTPQDVVIQVTGSQNFTTQDETLITQSLTSYVQNIRPFITGADLLGQRNDVITLTGAIAVVQNVIGLGDKTFTGVVITVGGTPVDNNGFQFTQSNIPFLTSVTYP